MDVEKKVDPSERTRRFDGPSYTVMAHPRSCFFCGHLRDIVYDYTNGPYMFFCDLAKSIDELEEDECSDDQVWNAGLLGMCKDFVEGGLDHG